MGDWRHTYSPTGWCEPCRGPACTASVPPPIDPDWKPPKELCSHPEDSLVQMGQEVCDPDLVTVCTRCGTAFPGKTAQDLLAA